MVVTFIVDKPGLIIVLDNIRIGSIDNVAPIAGENTMVFDCLLYTSDAADEL